MRRIWLEPSQITDSPIEISGEAFHHAIQVSRFRIGEEFEIVFGGDEALCVRLIELRKKSAMVEIVSRRSLPQIKKPYINLALAIPRWSTYESILEKSVELGVSSIQPLFSEFSFVRAPKDYADSRRERLAKIIKSATEQSGRAALLQLREPQTLQQFIANFNQSPHRVGLFAYEGKSALDIRTQMQRLSNQDEIEEIWIFVGSEGGFSVDEVAMMEKSGFPPVTLGPQILRVETACFALISVIKYQLGLMK